MDKLGRVCLDILREQWSPALQMRTVLLSVRALLAAPNPHDPLSNDVAKLWIMDQDKALDTAREWTQTFAEPNDQMGRESDENLGQNCDKPSKPDDVCHEECD